MVLIQVIIPAQRVAAEKLVLTRIGSLRGTGLAVSSWVDSQLVVAETPRRVVPSPAKAAERKAHAAGAVAAVQIQRSRAGAGGAVRAELAAAQVTGLGDDIEHPARPFGVVLGRGRGDDFHRLNLVGGQLAQAIGHAASRNSRGFAIDKHPDAGIAANAQVALQVHAEQGHAPEHVGGIAAAGRLVVFGVIHRAVGLLFHQRLGRAHHYLTQLLRGRGQRQCAEGHYPTGRHHNICPAKLRIAQGAHLHAVGAGRQARQHKLAGAAPYPPAHGRAGGGQHRYRGVGDGRARGGIHHGASQPAGGLGSGRGGRARLAAGSQRPSCQAGRQPEDKGGSAQSHLEKLGSNGTPAGNLLHLMRGK